VPVTIRVINTKFSKTYSTFIAASSSLTGLSLAPISTPILANTAQKLQLSFSSLGEPSCALLTYTLNTIIYNIGVYGTSSPTCSAYYPNAPYLGAYTITGSHVEFALLLNKIGFTTINVNATNSFGSSQASAGLNVLSAMIDCESPVVDIEKKSPLFYSPSVHKKNELFSLIGSTVLACNVSAQNKKEWIVYKIDESTGMAQYSVSLPNNPTTEYAELVVQPNSLSYGLYMFRFRVSMLNANSGVFEGQVESFVRVVPSGIVLSSLESARIPSGGTYELAVGAQQEVRFNPFVFTYDVDAVGRIDLLEFEYYCQVVELGVEVGYPMRSLNEMVDLGSFYDGMFPMRGNLTCFDSAGIWIYFSFLFYFFYFEFLLGLLTERFPFFLFRGKIFRNDLFRNF
jgi:hypothetical protein